MNTLKSNEKIVSAFPCKPIIISPVGKKRQSVSETTGSKIARDTRVDDKMVFKNMMMMLVIMIIMMIIIRRMYINMEYFVGLIITF